MRFFLRFSKNGCRINAWLVEKTPIDHGVEPVTGRITAAVFYGAPKQAAGLQRYSVIPS
jgi:hypothetical protein